MTTTTLDPDPFVHPSELASANARCDAELKALNIDPTVHIRPSWRPQLLLRRGFLTDKKIAAYQANGFYSEEFRAARRSLQAARQQRREGNFFRSNSGSLIYSPT